VSSRRRLAILAACVWAVAAVAAEGWKQAGDLLRQTLDEGTALVLTGLKDPLVLYREQPQLAANAREYVQVAPLEVNRQGELHYYLWMGVWSTIARGPSEGVQRRFEHLYLFVDEEPMELAATSWNLSARGADVRFYARPVATAVDAYYEVTADQVRRIGAARDVYLVSSLDPGGRYAAWAWNPKSLIAFADYTQDRQIR
jgi:hypothetical protein